MVSHHAAIVVGTSGQYCSLFKIDYEANPERVYPDDPRP
jgi:hypothetical protein